MWKCPPSSILVPVDFGDASARALEVASALVTRLNARLRVLHGEHLDAPPYFTHEQLATIERERRAAREKAGEFLNDFARRHGAAASEGTIFEGSPSAAIVEAARDADLVVMGTHGRHAPARWWMGSVAERVVRESAAPVLVVRADLGGVAPGHVFDRPLVVAPALTEHGRGPALLQDEARRVATGLAQAFGGRVSDTVARCQADVASERQATMLVVSKALPSSGGILSHPVEQWLRSCTLPMLFVPSSVVEHV